jgi:hypothetical protein
MYKTKYYASAGEYVINVLGSSFILIKIHIYYVLMYNILTSHMQKIIQIYPCLLKLLRKQDTILKIGDLSTKN